MDDSMETSLLRRRLGALCARGTLIGGTVVSLLAWYKQESAPIVTFDPLKDGAICTSTEPFSQEELGEPQHRFEIAVTPQKTGPDFDVPSFQVSKDDVIQIAVNSTFPGAVTVHGIMQLHRVRVGENIYLKFRAKYSGRFPLHFHGDDGQHNSIASFEVRSDMAKAAY